MNDGTGNNVQSSHTAAWGIFSMQGSIYSCCCLHARLLQSAGQSEHPYTFVNALEAQSCNLCCHVR